MVKSYYISPMRANATVEELMTGNFIRIDDYTYCELSKAPRGRRVMRKFINEQETESIKIYS
mgnify:CR=1 FL=1